MKIETVEGIVLRETNYSESSKILNILTIEHGLIGVISKGCRNMKSKLRGVSRKLLYAKFHIYYKENSLSTLIEVDVKNSYSNILTDLDRITYTTYILELVEQVEKQSDNPAIFAILKGGLKKINEGFNPLVITNIIELKCLEYLGVMPSLDYCSMCGSNKNIVSLSSYQGGFICQDCHTNEPLTASDTIKLVRILYYIDLEKITKLDLKEENINDINNFLEEYYDRYTGLYLKSKKTLSQIVKKITITT